MLRIGDRVPEFSVQDHRGETVSSAGLTAKGPWVLYFYPRDFTPGCTAEACSFRDAFSDISARSASIVGVSADDNETHLRFAKTYQLPFSLVSDPERALAKLFDVIWPIKILGARRVTFVIDRTGIVRGVFHHELAMKAHVDGVQKLLPELEAAAR